MLKAGYNRQGDYTSYDGSPSSAARYNPLGNQLSGQFYLPSELDDDSLSDNLSNIDSELYYPTQSIPKEPETNLNMVNDIKIKQDWNESNLSESEDCGYQIEVPNDPTTPMYAPSIPHNSDSGSDYNSTSSTRSAMRAKIVESDIFNDNDQSPYAEVSDNNEEEELKFNDVKLNSLHGTINQPLQNLFDDNEDDRDNNKFNEDFEGFDREDQPEVEGIIADIFGESDAEEEFEGFAENELDKVADESEQVFQNTIEEHPQQQEDGLDDEGSDENGEFVSDFDRIMQKRKEECRHRRSRNKESHFLNDGDDLINEMMTNMRNAADEDRQLLAADQPATKKLTMLKDVVSLLKRADIKSALIDNGMLSVITEWLSPLPGHTLPNLVIRDLLLNCLTEFQSLSSEVLQESGIGKALMYLYKHPRETRENKDKAGRLINEWLRPIFNLTSDYRSLTREERKQLDYEHLPKRRHIESNSLNHRDINRELDGESKGMLRPGDPGWVGRARVPQPSNKDYIIRPKWRVSTANNNEDSGEEDENTLFYRRRRLKPTSGGVGPSSRIEGHIRNLVNSARRGHAKTARAVPMSIEGRKMSL